MVEEVAALSVRLEATAARFERDMQRAQRSMRRATGRMERRADRLDRRLERVGNRFGINLNPRIIAGTAALAAFGKAINDVIRNGDRLKQLEGRFRALTGSASRAGDLIQSAFAIGSDTGAPFEAITEALTRFRIAGDAINATDEEVAQLTGNLLKLGQIGGSTTQELTAGAIQLGQGLASGALRGEELRSVMENLPLVARELAEGLGVSVGELREMGAAGELTAERVFGALIRGSDDIEERFSNLPVTVERAANQAASSWTRFTAEIDKSTGASEGLAASLQGISSLLDNIVGSLEQAGEGGGLSGLINRLGVGTVGTLFGADIGEMNRRRAEAIRQSGEGVMPPLPVGSGGTRQAPQSLPKGAFPPPVPPFKFSGGAPGGFAGFDPAKGSEPKTDETAVQMLQSLRERIELLREEKQLVGTSAIENARLSAAFERSRIEQELLNAAAREGATITPEQIAQAKEMAALYEQEAIALAQMEEALRAKQEAEREAEEAAQRHAQAVQQIGDAITGAIQQADSFADALKNVALQLANIALQGLQQPGGGIIGNLFPSLFGGGGGGGFPTSVHGANLSGLTFDRGGPTGGRRGQPAGVVHGEEFVVRAGPAQKHKKLLEAINQGSPLAGFDKGGFVSSFPSHSPPRIDMSGSHTESSESGNVYNIDARGTTMEVVNELRKTLFEWAGPGRVERRAVSAVSTAQHRGQRLGPRG